MLSCGLENISLLEIFELLKNILLGITGIVGSIVAWRGLNTWKRQISGEHQHETAMKLLRSLIEVRSRIKDVRRSIDMTSEHYDAFKEIEGREPANSSELDQKDYLRIVRGKRLNDALDRLDVAKIDTEIVFDALVISEVEKISKFIAKLNKSIMVHNQAKMYPAYLSSDENKKAYEVLYSNGPDDVYGQEIELIIKNVRELLKEFIS
ncbi:hypothetical protein CH365_19770 [Leptospira neocaledonica]|uniref:Uncharacterized protein n=2 Tax=Leptospira neocaledonica TaxID=2023192 RepID=A0A2M9ZT51_9LEPT|nr:hypothetical protein CH365_19770 [Leptospira neocaledonica]